MNKPSFTRGLIAVAALTCAGIASAGATFDVPYHQAGEASTMTMGAPNMLTQNSTPMPAPVIVDGNVDTAVLGAAPVEYTTTIYPSAPVVRHGWGSGWHGSATNQSSVPDRAGELSTISGGVPNMVP